MDRCWTVGRSDYLKDKPYSKRYRGGWAGGPLYFLGADAVEMLVRDYTFFPAEFAGKILEDKVVGDILRAHHITVTQAPLPEIFGIDFPVDGFRQPPVLTPLTIDWQSIEASRRIPFL